MVHPMNLGKSQRMSYSKSEYEAEMPNLIEIQKDSFKRFLEYDLKEVFRDVSPITDFTGDLVMEFVDYSLSGEPKYSVAECRERDATYAAPLKVKVRLISKKTGEMNEQEVYMGEFPLMTSTGTFVINGAERVIVTQVVRSPGIYYKVEKDKSGRDLFSNTVIPNRGAWLEYETDSNDTIQVRIDRTRKLPITVLLRAIGYGTDAEIIDLLGEDKRLEATFAKDNTKTYEEGLQEIYKRLRPGEPPTVESAQSLFNGMFFDPKRYDLARVGRYKYNKKLSIATRLTGLTLARPIVDDETGEVLLDAGEVVEADKAKEIQNAGINVAYVTVDGEEVKIIGNNTVDMSCYVDFDPKEYGINELVNYGALKRLLNDAEENNWTDEQLKLATEKSIHELIPKHITVEDIVSSISYLLNLEHGLGSCDDIDHLGNRRLRAVGELLQN